MIRIYERSCIEEFTFSSIAAGGSGGGALDFYIVTDQKISNGVLRGVSAACNSLDFDVSLRTSASAAADTVDEIYRATGINKYRSDDNLYQGWVNTDATITSKLYLTLTNNDLVNATGVITIKIVTDINRKFTRNVG